MPGGSRNARAARAIPVCKKRGGKSSCGGTHEGEVAKAKKGSYGSEYATKNEA